MNHSHPSNPGLTIAEYLGISKLELFGLKASEKALQVLGSIWSVGNILLMREFQK